MHSCKKTCYKSQVSIENNRDYMGMCINGEDTNSNVYDYCQTRLGNYDASITAYCKLDMCNLCCVSMEKIRKKSY